MRVSCPFCKKEFDEPVATPGAIVTCPYCSKSAKLPAPASIAPSYSYAPAPRREAGISTTAVAVIVIVGVLIFFIGAIICNASVTTGSNPSTGERESARLVYKVGTILVDTGALVACLGIFSGALASKDMDIALRIAMLSVGTAIIIVVLVVMLFGGTMSKVAGL